MTGTSTPGQFEPPSGKSITIGALIALAVAIVVLIAVIWPAEYGRDPTGIGGALGITGMSTAPTVTIEVVDTIGGNENLREVEIPDFGDPVPLPNPNVHQAEADGPKTRTMTVELDVDGETEVKAVLGENQVIVYHWTVDDGIVYSDFHGHNPDFGRDFWVQYQEDQRGAEGGHNLEDHPVTITLTITGFFEDMVDYSELF
jgi:hypothetical protein